MTTTQGWSSSNHRSFLVFTLFSLLLNCCTNSTISWFFMCLQLHPWIRLKQLALRCFSFLTSKNRFLLHSNYLNFLPTTYHGRKLVIYFETCAVRSFSHLALKSECKQRWLILAASMISQSVLREKIRILPKPRVLSDSYWLCFQQYSSVLPSLLDSLAIEWHCFFLCWKEHFAQWSAKYQQLVSSCAGGKIQQYSVSGSKSSGKPRPQDFLSEFMCDMDMDRQQTANLESPQCSSIVQVTVSRQRTHRGAFSSVSSPIEWERKFISSVRVSKSSDRLLSIFLVNL